MVSTSRLVIPAVALLALSGAASAQFTRAVFQDVDALNGVSVTSSDLLHYNVTVDTAPTLLFEGNLYTITHIGGFFVLSDDDDVGMINNAFPDADGLMWTTGEGNQGPGGVGGWDTSYFLPGITAGDEPIDFIFNDIWTSIEGLGLRIHVSETLPNGINFGYFVVPTPGAAALLGMGGLAAARRRRR